MKEELKEISLQLFSLQVILKQDNRTASVFINDDTKLNRSEIGREVVVAVTEGKMDFGPWEQIFYGEFDGKRRKRVLVKIIGE